MASRLRTMKKLAYIQLNRHANGNRPQIWRAKDFSSVYDSSVLYGNDAIGQLTSAVRTETWGPKAMASPG